MNNSAYLVQEMPQTRHYAAKKSSRISFLKFQKVILANSRMRKQIKDVVDLALFENALQQNTVLIESIQEKAEDETIQLLMKFVNGISDYQALGKIIYRNRVIKTLATRDKKEQTDLIERVAHHKSVK